MNKNVLLLALLSALALPSAHAADNDDLARRLQACAACHGKEGRAAPDGYYPRIAGKPAGYLFNQLVNFRDGRRKNADMAHLTAQMSDAYLREIAGYFSALELPYAEAPPQPATAAELARGATLTRDGDKALGIPACAACHGQKLTGTLPAVPGLLGLPRSYLGGQLGAWQTHIRATRKPDCMADIANRLSPADVAAVSGWLAQQPLPADTRPAPVPSEPLPVECGSAR
ncbi:c-type cytochrome [Paucibacter sp. R3-3]|uniref:C-type cytochrome n=1 Tax=Roseateles agri TaxID=3098619 RepID=A0ABU5DCC6_9BURK|nr:c-type cytochrome [Paucibacter sp. R3-3]MDY0743920.1 c-type cytochrome [Paucibacter sp. R3-3]